MQKISDIALKQLFFIIYLNAIFLYQIIQNFVQLMHVNFKYLPWEAVCKISKIKSEGIELKKSNSIVIFVQGN